MAARPHDVVRQADDAEWIALKTPMKILSVNLERSWSYEIIEGLSRQLRAPLHHDPMTGAYEIAIAVMGRD
jgi:hypothetical protein